MAAWQEPCKRLTIVFLLYAKGRGWVFLKTSSVHLLHFSQILQIRFLAWIATVLTSYGFGQGRVTITLNCLVAQLLVHDRK